MRALVVLLVGAAACAAGWSARSLMTPPAPPVTEVTTTSITAESGQLQQQFTATAQASWADAVDHQPVGEGTVTKRYTDDVTTIRNGTKLFDVNLVPTYAATGTVPMFRELTLEASGDDVVQVQKFLRSVRYRSARPNGVFDEDMRAQVEAWQKATKQPVTGTIPLGQFMFFSNLPFTGYVSPSIKVGTRLGEGSGGPQQDERGEAVTTYTGVVALPDTPSFTMSLSPAQLQLVEQGMPVTIRSEQHEWQATIGEMRSNQQEQGTTAVLRGVAGASVCGDQCSTIPPSGARDIPSTVTVLPLTEGTVIPTTALTVNDSGKRVVTLADGTQQTVDVTASVGGEAIVTGITPGTQLVVQRRGD